MAPNRIVILANGVLPDLDAARRILKDGDYIIGADAGAHHARALQVRPDLVIGDMDSLGSADRAWLEDAGVRLLEYPRDKNETDLELALLHAIQLRVAEIVIMGALGARLDQTLANIALLADDRLVESRCWLDDGAEQVFLCRTRAQLRGSAGDLVSLLPWGVPAVGVHTSGLKWPLSVDTLRPDRSRGVSNELLGELATISVESGALLIVHRRQQGDALPGT